MASDTLRAFGSRLNAANEVVGQMSPCGNENERRLRLLCCVYLRAFRSVHGNSEQGQAAIRISICLIIWLRTHLVVGSQSSRQTYVSVT